MSSIYMGKSYFKEVEKAKAEHWPVLIPIGTVEYHSVHCPYGCDTLVAMGLADKIAEKTDCVVMPPVWYGVASYAVGGPEKNTLNVDCDTYEDYIYCILKSLFRAGFYKNIYFVLAHQDETELPMELACLKAAKKLTFEYIEEKDGCGWWGNNKNKDFYENLSGGDNPWNWVRVLTSLARAPRNLMKEIGGDHAGKTECSILESLYPNSIKLERLRDCDDWFAQDSFEMSAEYGAELVRLSINEHLKTIRGIEE